jgi:NAD(P)-dependent dehydrogenase (short-subunit alcohol dehydrogenase family)
MGTAEDLQETVRLVEQLGRRIVARKADVRDLAAVQSVVDAGMTEFGRIDIVLANAGICPMTADDVDPVRTFRDTIDVDIVGVWNTVRAAVPALVGGGRGGSIVFIGSTAGVRGMRYANAGAEAYTMAKHGMVGLMLSLANRLAVDGIRVNVVHPTGVQTLMIDNEPTRAVLESATSRQSTQNLLDVGTIEPIDVSNAILWLVSDEARYVTGISLPVDAGYTASL